jgi:phosphoglycerate dehydrogenase-like enzyme
MWRQGTLDFRMALRLGLIGLGAIGRGVLRLLTSAGDFQVVGAPN